MERELRVTDAHDVCRLLKPAAAKWYNIGVLLKVSDSLLVTFEQRCQTDEQRLFTMISAWLQRKDINKTYAQIVKVLRKKVISEKNLAADIRKAIETPQQTRADIMLAIQPTPPTPEPEAESVHPNPPEMVATRSEPLPSPKLEQYLRMYYTMGSETRADDWPPSFHTEYVNLVLVPQQRKLSAKSRVEEVIKLSVHGHIKRIADGQRLGLNDILTSDGTRVAIVNGGPGAGKTTLAKKLRREWANRKLFSSTRLALYVPLREPIARLSEHIDDLLNVFGEECNEADRALVKASNGDGVLFILDGWDELRLSCRGEKQFFPRLISGQTLPGSKVIVFSRPGASVDIRLHHADQVVEVLGFTKEQVEDYIHNYYSQDKDGASKLIRDLEKYPNVASTCYVPINLAIVCHVYNALDFNLPPTITEVYQWFIIHTVLRYLKRKETMEDLKVDLPHIAQPRDFFVSTVFNDSVKKNFNDSILETLNSLGELAINGLLNDDLCFSRKQLITACKLEEHDTEFDGFGLLKPVQISSHSSIRAESFYHFLHLSIQEFIAGFYVSQLTEKAQEEYLSKIDHERFSDVFKHFCGLDQFKSTPLRQLFERKQQFEVYHLEGIHEGQWHEHCKEIARKCDNTFRLERQLLQPHQWEVLSYVLSKSGAKWSFECSVPLLDVNGIVCFSRYLTESSQVLHCLCFKKVHIDHQAYVQVARVCQMQAGLTKLEFLGCNLSDDGAFTILEALESHPSLKILCVHDDTLSAVASSAFVKLLPTLSCVQLVEVSIKNFRDRDYLDIIQCAKKCSVPPQVSTPNNPIRGSSLAASITDMSNSTSAPLAGDDTIDSPSVTIEELVEYLGLDIKLLDQRCQESELEKIVSVLSKNEGADMPLLKLTKADFISSDRESIILCRLQAWKKRSAFKATYRCLVQELLSCGNAELAEEMCDLVRGLSLHPSSSTCLKTKIPKQTSNHRTELKEVYVPIKRSLDSTPKLHELDRLEDGKRVLRIIRMVMAHWERIATRLYFEDYIIYAIKRNNNNSVENACMEVFFDWLRGIDETREPRTWRTLIKVLKEAELSEIATKVEDILTPNLVDS